MAERRHVEEGSAQYRKRTFTPGTNGNGMVLPEVPGVEQGF